MNQPQPSRRVWSSIETLVSTPHAAPGRHGWIFVAAIVSVVTIGVVDYYTAAALSFTVVYMVPVVAVALLCGTRIGVVVALVSAVVWVTSEQMIRDADDSMAILVANSIMRWVVLSFVVVLIVGFHEALGRARTSDARSREFLAFAAHQLRTPVAGVQATAEALIMQDGARNEALLTNLARESARVGRLVTSLLRMARLDQGEPLDMRATNLVDLCRDEMERFDHLSTHVVTLTVDGAVPEQILIDPSDVAEILGNLLDNACRYAHSRVGISVSADSHDVRVQVNDDGPGLPVGKERLAFERFVSLDNHGGSGLGLAIARTLAAKQGGTLEYANRTFTLTLPVRAPAAVVAAHVTTS